MPGMPSRPSAAATTRRPRIDAPDDASLSVAPPDPLVGHERKVDPDVGPSERIRAPEPRTRRRRPRLIVEGGRPASVPASLASAGGPLGAMPDYPVQVSKVQAPPLRDETLARDRLLDWLSVKIHRRAVLLTAEAGYGKTTLLADFTRRTRIRVLWFRLDRGDRDWTGFIAYLVAAVRIHVPDFAPSTRGLIRETAASAPSLEIVLETLLRELAALPADPTAFVFDDFHLVDDSPDIRHVVHELLTRGPERMSFVFASRREPPIRLARLRALGEVAELGTDDLRFDAAETERLFRDTYEMRLEPTLLAELGRRTEGWAASLQLVRAALHDRDPSQVRSFISSLSGAEGHLYEYLAEEVIGELPDDLQQFLMRTSVLETVDLMLGPVAAEVSVEEATRLIEEGESAGLLGKGGPRTLHNVRAHPLVRDFLQARLARAIGADGFREIHFGVASKAEGHAWQVAVRHYILAGALGRARTTLEQALKVVLATGAYAAAQELAIALGPEGLPGPAGLVVRSRAAQQAGLVPEAVTLAEQAWGLAPESTPVLLNLMAARNLAGDLEGALQAGRLLASAETELSDLGRATQMVMRASVKEPLDGAIRELEELADGMRGAEQRHFYGVAHLDLALLRTPKGAFAAARDDADEAIVSLSATSAGVELISARLAKAAALAFLGQIGPARDEIEALRDVSAAQSVEVAFESAFIEGMVGDPIEAWPRIRGVGQRLDSNVDYEEQLSYGRALLDYRDGSYQVALSATEGFRYGEVRTTPCFDLRRHFLRGLVLASLREPSCADPIAKGIAIAQTQGADFWTNYGLTLQALADDGANATPMVLWAGETQPIVLSTLADLVLRQIPLLEPTARLVVTREAIARPVRWRSAVRMALRSQDSATRQFAAELLVEIGETDDVRRLRDAGRSVRGRVVSGHAVRLARRLADRVFVEDLGRVRIVFSDRVLDSAAVRRKVLALLCLLISRPRFAATREEVVDSLWPDHDPESALNSLNQTVYFLRRVFEPAYAEETSPGYVGQDGETVWLDPELVDSRSRRCLDLVRSQPGEPTPDGALALAQNYAGRFALDFAYEDWSGPYRDSLHAGYLRVVEQAIQIDLRTGHFARGIYLAERAAEVDPDSEEIQVALVRLYRHSGAHAAAAEQYGHYAQAQRELGVEPLSIDDL
jgi:DNA-binding SARP family transcriptional activator